MLVLLKVMLADVGGVQAETSSSRWASLPHYRHVTSEVGSSQSERKQVKASNVISHVTLLHDLITWLLIVLKCIVSKMAFFAVTLNKTSSHQ